MSSKSKCATGSKYLLKSSVLSCRFGKHREHPTRKCHKKRQQPGNMLCKTPDWSKSWKAIGQGLIEILVVQVTIASSRGILRNDVHGHGGIGDSDLEHLARGYEVFDATWEPLELAFNNWFKGTDGVLCKEGIPGLSSPLVLVVVKSGKSWGTKSKG